MAASRYTPTGLLNTDPGPSLFPIIGGTGLLICGILIFFQKDRENEPQLSRDELSAIAKLAVLLVVYMLGLKYLGFLVITPIVLLVLSYMFTFGKPMALWKHLLYTVCVTGALYYVFVEILSVMLPRGVLF